MLTSIAGRLVFAGTHWTPKNLRLGLLHFSIHGFPGVVTSCEAQTCIDLSNPMGQLAWLKSLHIFKLCGWRLFWLTNTIKCSFGVCFWSRILGSMLRHVLWSPEHVPTIVIFDIPPRLCTSLNQCQKSNTLSFIRTRFKLMLHFMQESARCFQILQVVWVYVWIAVAWLLVVSACFRYSNRNRNSIFSNPPARKWKWCGLLFCRQSLGF